MSDLYLFASDGAKNPRPRLSWLQEGLRRDWISPVEPVTVICKHNTPDALTTSLFLIPENKEQIPEGTYALVRLGGSEDGG